MNIFSLPDLKYAYDSLAPHIDAKTMEIHHSKHHAGYLAKLNKAVKSYENLHSKSIEEILKNINEINADLKQDIINNGGGHANHSLFWETMSPNGKTKPSGKLAEQINDDFESFESFKNKFEQTAVTTFGSGWAWLVADSNKKLWTISTPNQNSPLMEDLDPLLGLDVWEHAYYLNYQNRRGDYVKSWWNVVDWEAVENNFAKAVINSSHHD